MKSFAWTLLFFCMVAVQSSLVAQRTTSVVPLRINVIDATTITAKAAIFAFGDASGQPLRNTTANLDLVENGVSYRGAWVADSGNGLGNLSLLVAMDLSKSSDVPLASTFTPLNLAKGAALAASRGLAKSFDEIGLVGIGAMAELQSGLSSDKTGFTNAVSGIRSSGGFNLRRGLFDVPGGALTHLQNARNARALLLLTDGGSSFDVKAAVSMARTYAIRVYVIGIGTDVNQDLRTLADSTGGAWIGKVTTQIEANQYAGAYVYDALRMPHIGTVTWTTNNRCDTQRIVVFGITPVPRQEMSYSYPAKYTRRLTGTEKGVDLGIVPIGESTKQTVVLTSVNAPVTITSYDLVTKGAFEIVDPPTLPVTLNPGQVISFTIKYTSASTDAVYARLNLVADACDMPSLVIRAGSVYSGEMLQLVSPTGNDQFTAGKDTTVRWTNALPDEFVRLEVSYDNGVNWYGITESATGLSYKWTPGPLVGDKCQMRVSSTVLDQRSVIQLRGQTQPLYSAVFTADDKTVLTGGDDGSVRAWDARTGQQTRIVGIHGGWVWSLAEMPGTTNVASISHDGTIRVWDYTSSRRIATINLDTRGWSLAFSADGKTLYAGTDKSLLRIATDSWRVESIKDALEGPVYDIHVASNATIVTAEGTRAVARDQATFDTLRTFREPTQRGAIYSVSMPSTNDVVITGGADFVLRKFQFSNGALLGRTTPAVGSILSLSYSPDNTQILTANGDASAKLYTASTLTPQASLVGHQGIVYDASFSSDARSVVTASTDYTGRVWPLDKVGIISDASDGTFRIVGGTVQSSNVSMGDVTVGEGADKVQAVITNTGSEALVIRSAKMLGSGTPQDFDVNLPALPITVSAGGELRADVSFTPSAAGGRSATLELQTGRGTTTVEITGQGVAPSLKLPETLNFGRHIANVAAVDSTITIVASGDQTNVYKVSLTQIRDYQSSVFSIVSGGGPFTMLGGETRKIVVRFDPKSFGRFAAVLNITMESRPAQVVRLYGEATGEGRLSATSSILFASTPCTASISQRNVTLRNTGNSQTILYSVGFEGANADEFSLISPPVFPYTMEAKDSLTFTVQFDPRRVGVKDVRLVASSNASNAINGRTLVSMIARRDSVGFELSRTTVDLGNVAEGESQSDRLQIINSGTISLQWPRGSINLGPFRIDSITPDITAGRRTSDMLVTFTGGQAGKSYETTYTFVDTICGRQQTVKLMASVKSVIGGRIRIGKVDARSGELVSVPVYVSNLTNMDRTSVREVTMHCTVNGRIITPSGSTPVGTLQPNGSRSFSVPVPLTSKDSLATMLTFQTTWGNDTGSVIRIDSFTVADTLQFRTFNGEVRLVDLCKISGRARLIALRSTGVGIVVTPAPAIDKATATLDLVERGRTSLTLYDTQGRTLGLLYEADTPPGRWTVPIDLSSLHNGTYFIVMQTPSESFTQRLEVVR
ncbi:MAG: choice-of-anchor D domain-containing protein [Candidatus Kapabacteria bacterium]|nr:choice-of-anchor D domain-containing protein [Candidatus Kapabacteria bacterium]